MKYLAAILLLALVLTGCGGTSDEARLVGRWTEQIGEGTPRTVTLTADHFLHEDGRKHLQCWAVIDGALHEYPLGKPASAGQPLTMTWNGDDVLVLSAPNGRASMTRLSTDGTLSAEGKLLQTELALDTGAPPVCPGK